jgi:hypothetical protein
MASSHVFMFCAPGHVFGGAKGVGSRFQALRARTHFRRDRGRRVPFSCFALPDTFSAVSRASGPVFLFCVPELIFGGTEGVGSRFHVFRSWTRFRRCGGRQVPFSCFALANYFSTVPRASCPVFMFCAPGHISTVPRASGPVFMFCALGVIFGDIECVRSRFHVLRVCTRFWRYRGVGSRFHVLRSRTRFRRYRGRWLPFSHFSLPDSFSAVPRASAPVFMSCAPALVFGGTEAVGSRFHVLRSRTCFRRCGGRRVPFSCFARQHSFLAVPRVSGPVFMFCALGLVFGCTEGVGSRFHVLCCRTLFRRCEGRRVPFSCFVLPDYISAVRWA